MIRLSRYVLYGLVLAVVLILSGLWVWGSHFEYRIATLVAVPVLIVMGGLLYREMKVAESLRQLLQTRIRENETRAIALKRSEEKFRNFVNSVVDGIVAIDRNGRILYCNAGAERVFQGKRSEMTRHQLQDLICDEEIGAQITTSIKNQSVVPRAGEYVLGKRLNGEPFPMEYSLSLLEDGEEQVFVGVFRDISVRVAALKQLRLLDKAVETISQGILVTSSAEEDFPIIYANHAFLQISGYTREEILGRNPRFLQGERTDHRQMQELRKALMNSEPVTMEVLNYRKSGEAFFNQLSIAPIRDDLGKVTHFVGVVNDVSQMNELREQFIQAQKMEAIGKLAGGVAHDFNNLLTVVNGYAQLGMGQSEGTPVFHQYFSGILEAGERASSLTRQLLAISKRQNLQVHPFDLNGLLEGMGSMLKRLLGDQVELQFDLENEPLVVAGDSGQLEQVILNLTINARDAMPNGGSLVWKTLGLSSELPFREGVSIPASLAEGDYVCLVCRDNGVGMDNATKQRIFEPFFSTKSSQDHDGLGLSTCFGIIQHSQGVIQVDSEVGKGTEFRIFLPWNRGAVFEHTDSRKLVTDGNFQGVRVLLVEDNPDVRGITRLFLESAGVEVEAAENGLIALEILEAEQTRSFDILITDILMPEMGGRELADAYLDIYPDGRVIFISGFTDEVFSRSWDFKGNALFLMKPFEKNQLFQAVQNLMEYSGSAVS